RATAVSTSSYLDPCLWVFLTRQPADLRRNADYAELIALRPRGLRCGRAHPDGLTAPAPSSGDGFKDAGAAGPACKAGAVRGHIPGREVVPVAPYQPFTACMTIGGLTGGTVNVAGVHVTDARLDGDAPRHPECVRRRRRCVHHLPVRVEGREMQRHIGAEVVHHPAALRFDLRSIVVLA